MPIYPKFRKPLTRLQQELLVQHLWIPARVARGFVSKNPLLNYDDLYQAGCLGSVMAFGTFNGQKEKLTTHIWSWAKAYIIEAAKHDRNWRERAVYSPTNQSQGEEGAWIESFEDPSVDIETQTDTVLKRSSILSQVAKSNLLKTPLEKDILILRLLPRNGEAKKTKEIAKKHNVSHQWVSQVEQKVKARIKSQIENGMAQQRQTV